MQAGQVSEHHILRGKQCCATEWDCGLEDSSTPVKELEHHAQVLPGRTACLQKDAAGPLPFLHSTDQPLGIKGQERGKERNFTKDDTDRIAGLGMSSGDRMGLQNLHDVQPVWFIFLLAFQQWECWNLSTLSSPCLPLQSLSFPTHPG